MKKRKQAKMSVINPDAAGVDIGSGFHYVAVPEDRDENPVRRFDSYTRDLHRIAKWLKDCGIKTVAMESTGIYWLQLFLILEQYGFEVYLVNAHHVKNVTGRKSDISDCQWIQQLHSYGLLKASYQPEELTRSLRGYMRHRKNLTRNYATHVLRMQKALEQMNIKLHNVLTDITGKSGQLMIKAILKGERNAEKLASLADKGVKSTQEELMKSLEGNWWEEPLFELRQSYELYLIYKRKIADCDRQIEKAMRDYNPDVDTSDYKNAPRKVYNKNRLNFNASLYIKDILGVDVTQVFGINEINAAEIISEVGVDMSKWPSEKHFTSWLNLAPNKRTSGGKTLKSKKQKKKNRAGQAFQMAAYALQRSNHWLGAFYRRKKARSGPLIATKATAAKLAVIFYKMIKFQQEFVPLPIEDYTDKIRQQKINNLHRQASKLNLGLVPLGQVVS